MRIFIANVSASFIHRITQAKYASKITFIYYFYSHSWGIIKIINLPNAEALINTGNVSLTVVVQLEVERAPFIMSTNPLLSLSPYEWITSATRLFKQPSLHLSIQRKKKKKHLQQLLPFVLQKGSNKKFYIFSFKLGIKEFFNVTHYASYKVFWWSN